MLVSKYQVPKLRIRASCGSVVLQSGLNNGICTWLHSIWGTAEYVVCGCEYVAGRLIVGLKRKRSLMSLSIYIKNGPLRKGIRKERVSALFLEVFPPLP